MNGVPTADVLPVALGDDASDRLASLFDTHYDRLHRLARRLAPSADAARDLVQETFLRAAKSIRRVPRGTSNEEAWLVRVLVNLQRDEWRRTAVRTRDAAKAFPIASPADADAAFVARATVWRALDSLTARRRAIVVLHELDELPVPAIASMLGITRVTVRWHLSQGRRELARLLGADSGDRHETR
jgi:RNA polymerase sigma-70 factor (ECF subfamily)